MPPDSNKKNTPDSPLILYIEDSEVNATLMKELITILTSYQYLHCENAEEGIELAREKKPSLIFMDIELPGMDGYKALEILKSDPLTSAIPVFGLSANALISDIQKGERSDFERYITKPFNFVEVVQLIESYIK